MTYKVLVAAFLAEGGRKILNESPLVEKVEYIPDITRSKLLKIIGNFDGIIVRGSCPLDREAINQGKKIKIIITAGAGIDHIDVKFAEELGIIVQNTPAVNTDSVAELVIGLAINLLRNIPPAVREVQETFLWDKRKYMGQELAHKNLGIIGFGQIGKRVAELAQSFKMSTLAFDPYVKEVPEQLSTRLVFKEELLSKADIITVHVPFVPETRNLIDNSEINKMKDGAYLLNMSRGGVVNEEALFVALRKGKLSGAAMDVIENEPKPGGKMHQSNLLGLDNVIITPHIGAWTKDAQDRVAKKVAENMLDYFKKEGEK